MQELALRKSVKCSSAVAGLNKHSVSQEAREAMRLQARQCRQNEELKSAMGP